MTPHGRVRTEEASGHAPISTRGRSHSTCPSSRWRDARRTARSAGRWRVGCTSSASREKDGPAWSRLSISLTGPPAVAPEILASPTRPQPRLQGSRFAAAVAGSGSEIPRTSIADVSTARTAGSSFGVPSYSPTNPVRSLLVIGTPQAAYTKSRHQRESGMPSSRRFGWSPRRRRVPVVPWTPRARREATPGPLAESGVRPSPGTHAARAAQLHGVPCGA